AARSRQGPPRRLTAVHPRGRARLFELRSPRPARLGARRPPLPARPRPPSRRELSPGAARGHRRLPHLRAGGPARPPREADRGLRGRRRRSHLRLGSQPLHGASVVARPGEQSVLPTGPGPETYLGARPVRGRLEPEPRDWRTRGGTAPRLLDGAAHPFPVGGREVLPDDGVEHDGRDARRGLGEVLPEPLWGRGPRDVRRNARGDLERTAEISETFLLIRPDVGGEREAPLL